MTNQRQKFVAYWFIINVIDYSSMPLISHDVIDNSMLIFRWFLNGYHFLLPRKNILPSI